MLRVNNKTIPYFLTEIAYSNYLDYTLIEDKKSYKDVEVLTGVSFSGDFGKFSKKNIANSLRSRVDNYKPKKVKNFVHNDELYIIKDLKDITILEGVLALNFAKEFTKTKYQKEQGLFAMKLYLIATMTRKVVNGQIEELPVNLGEVHDFVEKRVKELEDISFKNAMDFEFFFAAFEEKLSSGFYKLAFKSIHPTNIKHIDNESNERFKRYSQVFGAFSILEYLLSNSIIKNDSDGLKTPFFHAVFLYSMSINK